MIKTRLTAKQATEEEFHRGREKGQVLQCTPTLPLLARLAACSLVVFGFGMCEDVRLQVGGLRKLFVAAVKGAHVRAVSSVNTHMCAQVKVQRESLATALERALKNERRWLVLLRNSLNISTAGIRQQEDLYLAALTGQSPFISYSCMNISVMCRQWQHSPGKVSPLCERVDASSALNSPQKPCRTRRRRAHGAHGCANASSSQSYP